MEQLSAVSPQALTLDEEKENLKMKSNARKKN